MQQSDTTSGVTVLLICNDETKTVAVWMKGYGERGWAIEDGARLAFKDYLAMDDYWLRKVCCQCMARAAARMNRDGWGDAYANS